MQLLATEGAPTKELPNLNNDTAPEPLMEHLHAELLTIGKLNKLLKLTYGEGSVRISLTDLEFAQLQALGIPVRKARITGW